MTLATVDKSLITEKRVTRYMQRVLSGKVPACKWVRLAVERQVRDLETGPERGLYFDASDAQIVVEFFGLLRHSKGKWARKAFKLEDWQLFILWVLFGWKRQDGSRRFRIAYCEIPRKNGKSTLAAGIELYLLTADGEDGAEVYTAATKMDQAQIIHKEAERMVRSSPPLRRWCGIRINNIFVRNTNSSCKPLGADAKTLDGLNPSGSAIDELHAHPTSAVWDIIDSALGSRVQPLIFAITTAGFNTQSFCYHQRTYTTKILDDVIQDDTWFGIIYTIDEGDDWQKKKTWRKANPNYAISVSSSDMERMAKKAREEPTARDSFLVKKLNVWTSAAHRWVDIEKWKRCPTIEITEEMLYRKPSYWGLDLSSNKDLAAWVGVFPWDDGQVILLPRFWVPRETAHQRERSDRVPYLAWAKEGLITLTEGSAIDFKQIKATIREDGRKFDIQSIGFDRWNMEAVRQDLIDEGIPEKVLVGFGQGYASMSGPMKRLEQLYISGKLVHNNHPVMTWCASNVVASMDAAENLKPNKEKSADRIDGVVSAVMGLGRSMAGGKRGSVYDDRGPIIF